MSYFEVRYFREALTTKGLWVSVMDGGFISEDCTKEQVDALVAEIVSWHDNIHSRISRINVRLINEQERTKILQSDACFWSRQLTKMTYSAIERFRQNNV